MQVGIYVVVKTHMRSYPVSRRLWQMLPFETVLVFNECMTMGLPRPFKKDCRVLLFFFLSFFLFFFFFSFFFFASLLQTIDGVIIFAFVLAS